MQGIGAYAQRGAINAAKDGSPDLDEGSMTVGSPGPAGPAGRMLIARGLVKLRERAGLTQGQVAKRAGCSTGTVSRYEMWQDRARIRWATVKLIAEACDAAPEERDALVELAQAQLSGWWVDNPAIPQWMDPLVSFEDWCEYEHVWASNFVPGLLQTEDYALALHRASETRAPDDVIERMVQARMRRQEILTRESSPLHLWVILDEAVLHRPAGGREVMTAQIDHLLDMSRQPHIDVQVLPYSAGAHAASAGHFMLLGRDDECEPLNSMAVGYIELRHRGLYLDAPAEVGAYKLTFDYLRSEAANAAASRRLLTKIRQEHAS